ncbi:protein unc-45 homolog A [Hydra vulgaris]|uniref:Protein unc-45 homolog A n=1 Tax=Hydra vulgaris TaxID=6087 RepID=A0ABM4CTG6_HYDVU
MVSSSNDWASLRNAGNNYFKDSRYNEAVESYTQAILLCDVQSERCILHKNRCVCYLKLEKYQNACEDADFVLKTQPNDVKALFRRCQAYEAIGKLELAYKDIKRLIQLEPKNTAIQDTYRRLTIQAQEKVNKSKSTVGMIEEMLVCLSNCNETAERKNQAISNLVIYAHKPGPSDILFKGFFQQLIPLLSTNAEHASGLMKICHGFCEKNFMRSVEVVQIFPLEKFKELLVSFNDTNLVITTLSVIIAALEAVVTYFKELHKLKPEDEHKYQLIHENNILMRKVLEDHPLYIKLLNFLVSLLGLTSISESGRDAVIDAFVKSIELHKAISDFILENKGIKKMLDLAALSYFPMTKSVCKLPVSKNMYIHVSVVLSHLWEKIQYFEKDREMFDNQAETVVNQLLDSSDNVSNLQGLIVLSTVMMASRNSGQAIVVKNNCIDKVLVLACIEDELSKLLSAEALAYSASDKAVCSAIANSGIDIVQTLYHSSNKILCVRGLVILCKVAMKGGGNIKEQLLVDGGAQKLYKTCRGFLVNVNNDLELKKWACEGLAYLSFDAEVKEILVRDVEALNSMLDLAKSEDSTITYGICNALVNLTNAFDKPEKNPELEQLAKFAKQPIPEVHEKDSDEFVQKRIRVLMDNGIVSALVNLNNVNSERTKEMMSRIFCAVVEEPVNRGKVIAQGGVKTLLSLALKGTEKGMDCASQALAKIGITNDPRLAFSGQRCMEVVRPLIKLIHFKKSPLLRFEGLMALTNLASMNDDVRKRIMKEKGFSEIESLMFDEDDQLKCAAVQCMCNLVLNQDAFNMFKDTSSVTERLKLIVLYCGEDPPELSKAAAGTLAVLTSDPEICKMVVAVKSHLDILKYLVTNESPEFRHRGLFIVANMLESSKEIAMPLVEDELFDVLLALKVSGGNEKVQLELERCFSAAKHWKIITKNPSI